jgi:hypothetical protein
MGLAPFFTALRDAGHAAMISDQDKSGHWARKAKKARDAFRARDLAYAIDPQLDRLLAFLFPQSS